MPADTRLFWDPLEGAKRVFFFACKCYWDCFTLFVGVALTPFLTRKGGENGTEETVRTLHLPKRLFSSMIDNRLDTLVMSGVGVD